MGALIYASGAVASEINLPGFTLQLDDVDQGKEIASALQVLALLTVLSLAPALLIVLTAFTRIVVVLAILRQAFGMPSTPPNTVIISLALFLTLFTMMPVVQEMEQRAFQPLQMGEMNSLEAFEAAAVPLREFMISQTREKDVALILDMGQIEKPAALSEVPFSVLIPAFMLSELQTAFEIGFVIFLPFLLIDLVTASVLMAMGMIMVPPLTISLPIKLLMFVLIEGWSIVGQALIGSFV